MEVKKIVILVYKLTGGGAERVASLWANGFAERGYDVTIITTTGRDEDFTYNLSSSVEHMVIELPVSNKIIKGILNRIGIWELYFSHKLRKVLHEKTPDLCIGVLGDFA